MTKNGYPLIVYGTKSGSIGAIELTKDEAIVLWETDFTFETKSIVSHIKVAQLKEGTQNIVVTREDGLIEIHSYTERQAATLEFECREQDEQITGLTVGFITTPKHPEVLYTCYSGAVKSICDRKSSKKIGMALDEQVEVEAPQQQKKEK